MLTKSDMMSKRTTYAINFILFRNNLSFETVYRLSTRNLPNPRFTKLMFSAFQRGSSHDNNLDSNIIFYCFIVSWTFCISAHKEHFPHRSVVFLARKGYFGIYSFNNQLQLLIKVTPAESQSQSDCKETFRVFDDFHL